MLLELHRFAPDSERARLGSILERGTGQRFGPRPGPLVAMDLAHRSRNASRVRPLQIATLQLHRPDLPGLLRAASCFDDSTGRDSLGGRKTRRHTSTRPPGGSSTAADAEYLDQGNIVFGVELNGQARAYPKRILAWHEMVKDTLGDEHFTGVYCTLCGSMILYRSEVDGTHHELGTSRASCTAPTSSCTTTRPRSLWSTLTGGPALGQLVGAGIELEPLYVVTTDMGTHGVAGTRTRRCCRWDTGYDRDYGEGVAYRDYFASGELMFAVPETDHRLLNKDEVLALRFPGAPGEQLAISVAFPLIQADLSRRPGSGAVRRADRPEWSQPRLRIRSSLARSLGRCRRRVGRGRGPLGGCGGRPHGARGSAAATLAVPPRVLVRMARPVPRDAAGAVAKASDPLLPSRSGTKRVRDGPFGQPPKALNCRLYLTDEGPVQRTVEVTHAVGLVVHDEQARSGGAPPTRSARSPTSFRLGRCTGPVTGRKCPA